MSVLDVCITGNASLFYVVYTVKFLYTVNSQKAQLQLILTYEYHQEHKIQGDSL